MRNAQRLSVVPSLAALALAVAGLAPHASRADTMVQGEARGPTFPAPSYVLRDPVFASGQVADGSALASSSAELSTGELKVFVTSDIYGTSSSQAQVSDFITFNDGASGTAYLDWSFAGTIAFDASSPAISLADLAFFISGAAGTTIEHHVLGTPGACDRVNATTCAEGSAFAASGSVPIVIGSGTFYIQVDAMAQAQPGAIVDFANTAHLFLRTPVGVTYTSDSGLFLAAAPPIVGAVPEPGAMALMATGLCLLVARGTGRRRRQRRASSQA